MKNTLRKMASVRKELSATALLADQSPQDAKQGLWLNFLNQETLVYTGPEKVAKMFDFPVVYMRVDRIKRGKYEITPSVITETPKTTEENEITITFNKVLEEDIRSRPSIWLWSHRRWKHKR